MADIAARKGTILIPSGPSHDPNRKHLFVVCTEPCENESQLIVPVSTVTNSLCDQTCIIQAHEHGFLRHESFAFYRKSRVEPREALLTGVQNKLFVPHDDMNAQTFLRVFNGICRSPETPRKIKIYADC